MNLIPSDVRLRRAMRAIVAMTAMAWFGITFFIPHPEWVWLPLWALYPGQFFANGSPNFS